MQAWIKMILVIFLGMTISSLKQGITKNKDTFLHITKEMTDTYLRTINRPPAGKLPEDVYTACDRYWILTKIPQDSVHALLLDFDCEKFFGIFNVNELIILSRPDSSKKWSKMTHDSILPDDLALDGLGRINLQIKSLQPGHEFTLAQSINYLPANQPVKLTASIKYGPVEICWQTQFEVETKFFTIERKIENQNWENIAEVAAVGFSAFPQDYEYDDINTFPNGTRLQYRVTQVNSKSPPTISLPIELDYLPEAHNSLFSQVRCDASTRAFQLKFSSAIYGYLRIDLFDADMQHEICLLEREILPGNYAYNVQPGGITTGESGFCRLEIISPDQRRSFIQIRQVSNGRVF